MSGMDWSFAVGDPAAKYAEPPAEIGAPVREAAKKFSDASAAAREAADELAEVVRVAAAAGHGKSWIGVYTGLAQADVERVLSGKPLY